MKYKEKYYLYLDGLKKRRGITDNDTFPYLQRAFPELSYWEAINVWKDWMTHWKRDDSDVIMDELKEITRIMTQIELHIERLMDIYKRISNKLEEILQSDKLNLLKKQKKL